MRGIVKGGLNDSGNVIKSMQRGITSGTTATLTEALSPAVDLTKSIIEMSRSTTGTGSGQKACTRAKIVGSDVVFYTLSEPGGTYDVSWTVTEFNNLKSLQYGDFSWSLGADVEQVVAVSSVVTSKSKLYFSYTNASTTVVPLVQHRLISETSIGFKSPVSDQTVGTWYLVEFN